MSGKERNRCSLEAVWERKVSSTVKPCRASRSAGSSTVASFRVPHRSSAACQVAGVPGVPTDRPLVTASAKGSGLPSSVNSFSSAVSGAVSRPSMVRTVRDPAS
ncbi:hypothetical protein STENM223S_07463 [Streptomyces tendae]